MKDTKSKDKNNPFTSDTMTCLLSIDLFLLFFWPVQRKSGMSGALYGQGDVISSSYGAERKLCLVEGLAWSFSSHVTFTKHF